MKRVGCACPRSSASVSHYYNHKVNQASLVLTAIVIVIWQEWCWPSLVSFSWLQFRVMEGYLPDSRALEFPHFSLALDS